MAEGSNDFPRFFAVCAAIARDEFALSPAAAMSRRPLTISPANSAWPSAPNVLDSSLDATPTPRSCVVVVLAKRVAAACAVLNPAVAWLASTRTPILSCWSAIQEFLHDVSIRFGDRVPRAHRDGL